ncbi:hypothetical protein GF324_02210 [bacterium]|nr:hypothetical protein [bacterium]
MKGRHIERNIDVLVNDPSLSSGKARYRFVYGFTSTESSPSAVMEP